MLTHTHTLSLVPHTHPSYYTIIHTHVPSHPLIPPHTHTQTNLYTHTLSRQASLGIAERIAGFLSLRDLGAYFGLDELGSKVCVEEGMAV